MLFLDLEGLRSCIMKPSDDLLTFERLHHGGYLRIVLFLQTKIHSVCVNSLGVGVFDAPPSQNKKKYLMLPSKSISDSFGEVYVEPLFALSCVTLRSSLLSCVVMLSYG